MENRLTFCVSYSIIVSMRIEQDIKIDFDNVLLKPKRSELSSRKEVELTRDFVFKYSKITITAIPIIAANMTGIGTFSMNDQLSHFSMFTALYKHYSVSKMREYYAQPREYAIYTLGNRDEDMQKLDSIYNENIRLLCVDVANGYRNEFIDFVQKIREKYPTLVIIAGNVVTPEMTEQLIMSGADIVKIGLGSGSVCTTRSITGVGYPQLSALLECSDAAHGLGGHVISDGGCTTSGDVAKAFAAGADFVMLGNMLAGTAESELKIIDNKYIEFFGMSSEKANNLYAGGLREYKASEGKETLIKYRGEVKHIINEILGGIRSSCTYIGAKRIKDIPKCSTFIRI